VRFAVVALISVAVLVAAVAGEQEARAGVAVAPRQGVGTVSQFLRSCTQSPFTQRPLIMHMSALPRQVVPSCAFTGWQWPVAGSHEPGRRHELSGGQTTGLPPTQTPLASQASVWVQALPSVQSAPSALAGFVHAPMLELHVPATWRWSLAVQAEMHVPPHGI
jgi:hypothetical protein